MGSKLNIQKNLLDTLSFRFDRYNKLNGEIHGFDELTESEFQLPPEKILTVVDSQIRALLGAKNEKILVVGSVNKHQEHFSEAVVRGHSAKDMLGKSYKELHKKGIWQDPEFQVASKAMDCIDEGLVAKAELNTWCNKAGLYAIKFIIIPAGDFRIAFSSQKSINPGTSPKTIL